VKKKCHDIRRKIEEELGVVLYDHIHAMCGPDFFDDLITHPEVKKAYERWLDGAFLRQGQARGSFEYARILFGEYRGKVGSVDFTDASKAYFFPVGVPGLFRQYNAPADFVENANTIGLPRYAKQAVDQQFARWVRNSAPPSIAERNKNGCGPSAAGNSSRPEGPNTAEPAAMTRSLVPEASLEPTDRSASTASTP
jgi:Phage major capsid protein E